MTAKKPNDSQTAADNATSRSGGWGAGFIVKVIVSLVGIAISGIYLANPGAGVFFEIPDNIPGIGNLDEVFFSGMFFYCLSLLGIHLLPGRKPKEIDAKK